jgi:hypothetical protein
MSVLKKVSVQEVLMTRGPSWLQTTGLFKSKYKSHVGIRIVLEGPINFDECGGGGFGICIL